MFKVAGVSTFKGQVKVRFANDIIRQKSMIKYGQTDVELRELPKAMTKPDAVKFLKTTDLYTNPLYQEAIDAADAKYNSQPAAVKVSKKKTAKPSLDAIKSRGKASKATAEATAAEPQTAETPETV